MPEQPEQKQETVGEVAAAMRRYADIVEAANADVSPELAQLLREYADRAERAADRDRDAVKASAGMSCELCERLGPARFGNAAAMREALNSIADIAKDAFGGPERHREASQGRALSLIIDAARAALAAPARNCDRCEFWEDLWGLEFVKLWPDVTDDLQRAWLFIRWLFATAEGKEADHAD